MRIVLSAALAALLLAPFAPPAADAQRLPTNARPEHYALTFTPDLATATFAGTETIDVTLAAPAATVTLNAIELKIQSASAGAQAATVSYDEAKEQATLTFPQPLAAGKASLQLAFTGILNDKLRGFYLSKTKARNYAVTQFESTDARRAFPCFDEPAYKATFDIALTVDAADTVISNGPLVSDKPAAASASGAAKHTLAFATTPKMSSYLVAFLVGDFACKTGKSEGVPIRVCATPDKVKLTPFALEAAEHFLTYYNRYFGIKYPMAKLDLIGIPDFEAGAMENFGAITYRETDLLVDEKDGSTNAKKRVASVVAHEMAHQWFGDMVTMQWWDNIWLNEGFATWMQDKACNDWKPEWNYPEDVADGREGTLNSDAVKTTRPIRQAAETPAQINELFDGIAYGKAGAMIGMVENWVGPKVFAQGVHNYLQAHLYANATAEDFWSAQTAVSHQPVDRVMRSFVDKPGVPLLTFSAKNAAGLPVAQTRFYLTGPTTGDTAGGWTIPVCLRTSGEPICRLLDAETPVLPVPADARLPLLYANAADKGYYRVQYTPEQTKAITAAAESTLSATERIGYVGDRWALMRSGQGSVGEFLDLALILKSDPKASLLGRLLADLGTIRDRIASEADQTKLDEMIRREFGPIYTALPGAGKKLTYDQEQERIELFGALGQAGDPAILAHAREIADELFSGKKPGEPELADVSVELAATHGDAAFYDKIKVVGESSADPGLQEEAQRTLTRFYAPALVTRTLEYATSGTVRNQDSWILVAIELGQPETRTVAWDWVQKHWDKVAAQLTASSGPGVVGATGAFCTDAQATEVQSFFAAHPVAGSERTLGKALDNIHACVNLRRAQEPSLQGWLAAHGQ